MDFILIIFWFGASFVIGAMGGGKKIGFWGAFFLSLIFSPLIGLIVVLVSPSPPVNSNDAKYFLEAKRKLEAGALDQAAEAMNKSINLNPTYPLSHYILFRIQALKRNVPAAMHSLNKAIELGFSDFDQLNNDVELIWFLKEPEFISFKENGYRLKPGGNQNYITELKELGELLKSNIITETEFNERKAKILNS